MQTNQIKQNEVTGINQKGSSLSQNLVSAQDISSLASNVGKIKKELDGIRANYHNQSPQYNASVGNKNISDLQKKLQQAQNDLNNALKSYSQNQSANRFFQKGMGGNTESTSNDITNTGSNKVLTIFNSFKSGIKDALSSFVSQLKGKTNTNENATKNNGNCGPACLTMVARAFGAMGGDAGSANGDIEAIRKIAGKPKEEGRESWMNIGGLQAAANKLDLKSKAYNGNGKYNDFINELNKGNRLIVNVGEHFVVAAGLTKDGKVIIQDPKDQKPRAVDLKLVESEFKNKFNEKVYMISLGPKTSAA